MLLLLSGPVSVYPVALISICIALSASVFLLLHNRRQLLACKLQRCSQAEPTSSKAAAVVLPANNSADDPYPIPSAPESPCGSNCRGSKARARDWAASEALPPPQSLTAPLRLDQHYLQPRPRPPSMTRMGTVRPCQGCSTATSLTDSGPSSALQTDSSASAVAGAVNTVVRSKFSGDGSPVATSSSLPLGACCSKHGTTTAASSDQTTPLASSPCAHSGSYALDTACRPDNTPSAYDTARAIVSRAWAQPYTPMFNLGRVAMKIPDRHPSDLPPAAVWTRPYCEALAHEGITLVGAYVREGCIHIVLDILDLAAGEEQAEAAEIAAEQTFGSAPSSYSREHLLRAGSASERRNSNGSTYGGNAAGAAGHGAVRLVDILRAQQAAQHHSQQGQGAGRNSAPGLLQPQLPGAAAAGEAAQLQHTLPTAQRPRRQGRRNAPVRVWSADAAVASTSLPARRAAVQAAATRFPSSVGHSYSAGGEGRDGTDVLSDSAHPRTRSPTTRRLRQPRRASSPLLVSSAGGRQAAHAGGLEGPARLSQTRGFADVSAADGTELASPGRLSMSAPASGPAGGERLLSALPPAAWVELLGREITGGGQTITVQLPLAAGTWNVQVGGGSAAAATAGPSPAQRASPAASPPDLICISPPCLLAGAQGPLIMYAAGTDLQASGTACSVSGDRGRGSEGPGAAAAATGGVGDQPLTVHVRYRGGYQPCRASLLGDQMPAEALSRVLPMDALRRAEVLCLQLPRAPPLPGLMFVECQRGGLLGAALPVLVAPNAGVWQEVAALANSGSQEGGQTASMARRLLLDLGLWFDYLATTPFSPSPAPQPQPQSHPLHPAPAQRLLTPLQPSLPNLQLAQPSPPPQLHQQSRSYAQPASLPPGAVLPSPQAGVMAPRPSTQTDPSQIGAAVSAASGRMTAAATIAATADPTATDSEEEREAPGTIEGGAEPAVGLNRLFGRSLLRLLSAAELELLPVRHSPGSEIVAEGAGTGDGLEQDLEDLEAEIPPADVPGCPAPSITTGRITALPASDLQAKGVSGARVQQLEQEAEIEADLGVAYGSSPGPDAAAATAGGVGCGDASIAFSRAISDPQQQRSQCQQMAGAATAGHNSAPSLGALCGSPCRGATAAAAASGVAATASATGRPLAVPVSAFPPRLGTAAQPCRGLLLPLRLHDGGPQRAAASAAAPPCWNAAPFAGALPSGGASACGGLDAAARLDAAAGPRVPAWQLRQEGRREMAAAEPLAERAKHGLQQLQAEAWTAQGGEGRRQRPPAPPVQQPVRPQASLLQPGPQFLLSSTDDEHTASCVVAGGSRSSVDSTNGNHDLLGLSAAMLLLGGEGQDGMGAAARGAGRTDADADPPPVRMDSSGTELHSWDSLTDITTASLLPGASSAWAGSPHQRQSPPQSPILPSRGLSMSLVGGHTGGEDSARYGRVRRESGAVLLARSATVEERSPQLARSATQEERLRRLVRSATQEERGGSGGGGGNVRRLSAAWAVRKVVASSGGYEALAVGLQPPCFGLGGGRISISRSGSASLERPQGGQQAVAASTAATGPTAAAAVTLQHQGAPIVSDPATAEPLISRGPWPRGWSSGGTATNIVPTSARCPQAFPRPDSAAIDAAAAAAAAIDALADRLAGAFASPAQGGSGQLDQPAHSTLLQQQHALQSPFTAPAADLQEAGLSADATAPAATTIATAATALAALEAELACSARWPAAGQGAAAELASRMRSVGVGLLAFAIQRGWLHTSLELLAGLGRMGMSLAEVNGAVAAREGGMGLLHLAVIARQPALLRALMQLAPGLGASNAPAAAPSAGPGAGEGLHPGSMHLGSWQLHDGVVPSPALSPGGAHDGTFLWDVGARGPAGLTPLHLSTALDDNGEMAWLLLEALPEASRLWFTAGDDSGCTPAEMATQARLEGLNQLAVVKLAEVKLQREIQMRQAQQQQMEQQRLLRQWQQQQQQQQHHEQMLQQQILGASGQHEQLPQQQHKEHCEGGSEQEAATLLAQSYEHEHLERARTRPSPAATAAAGPRPDRGGLGGGSEEASAMTPQGLEQRVAFKGAAVSDAAPGIFGNPSGSSWAQAVAQRISISIYGWEDPRVEWRYRMFRAASLSAVDATCGIIFTALFLLPALDLVRRRDWTELVSHCIFNAGLLGPYLFRVLAPRVFLRHRNSVILMGDTCKALLVLLTVLGVLSFPKVWANFSRGNMDVVMLVIIKPLSEQVIVPTAIAQRLFSIFADMHIYAHVTYAGVLVPSFVRAVLQNLGAVLMLLALDIRARVSFERSWSAACEGKAPATMLLASPGGRSAVVGRLAAVDVARAKLE